MAEGIVSNNLVSRDTLPTAQITNSSVAEMRSPINVLKGPETPRKNTNEVPARRLLPEFNEAMGEKGAPKKITGTAARTCRGSQENVNNPGSLNSNLDPVPTQTSQSSSASCISAGTGTNNGYRNYKEMLECVKKLHDSADKLHERTCRLHYDFANVVTKAAFLFTPEEVAILSKTAADVGIDELPDPDEVHFMREAVENRYEEMSNNLGESRPEQCNRNKEIQENDEPMQTATEA